MLTLPRISKAKVLVGFLFALFLCVGHWKLKGKDGFATRSDVKEESIYQRTGKVVILLSNQRSGSSFVGEFFNRHERGFYLFEPLLPYTPMCSQLYEERLDFLRTISHCDFRRLPSSYTYAYQTLKVKSHRECLSKHVCFINNHPTLLRRYGKLCESVEQNYHGSVDMEDLKNAYDIIGKLNTAPLIPPPQACGLPVNLTLWSSLCHSADLVAYKILRVCSLSALERISRQLTEMGNEVYVVELVRDPRAIINSALKLELKAESLNDRLDLLCGRYKENLDYVDDQTNAASTSFGIIPGGKYLRIRYEDIAVDPVKGAAKIYSHLGMNLPKEIKIWIEQTSISPEKTIIELKNRLNDSASTQEAQEIRSKILTLKAQKRSPYGTVRDPQEVLVKWRKQLPMNTIYEIQTHCGDVMKRMGYRLIKSEEERNDFSLQLW